MFFISVFDCFQASLEVGSRLSAEDRSVGGWFPAKVIAVDSNSRLKVHYLGFGSRYDVWADRTLGFIQRLQYRPTTAEMCRPSGAPIGAPKPETAAESRSKKAAAAREAAAADNDEEDEGPDEGSVTMECAVCLGTIIGTAEEFRTARENKARCRQCGQRHRAWRDANVRQSPRKTTTQEEDSQEQRQRGSADASAGPAYARNKPPRHGGYLKYQKECPDCGRVFTHPPAFSAHVGSRLCRETNPDDARQTATEQRHAAPKRSTEALRHRSAAAPKRSDTEAQRQLTRVRKPVAAYDPLKEAARPQKKVEGASESESESESSEGEESASESESEDTSMMSEKE